MAEVYPVWIFVYNGERASGGARKVITGYSFRNAGDVLQ